jgi:hypothetical protein
MVQTEAPTRLQFQHPTRSSGREQEESRGPPVSVVNPKSSILENQTPTTWYRLKHLQDYKFNTLQGPVEENEKRAGGLLSVS